MQVYILEKSDKVKTDKNPYTCRKVLSDDKKEIVIENLPVVVLAGFAKIIRGNH